MKPKAQQTFTYDGTIKIPLYRISMVRETNLKVKQNVNTIQLAVNAVESLYHGIDREMVTLLMLDTKLNIIGVNIVSVGTLDTSLICMREIYKPAIVAGAASIILIHNHPSGDCTPSIEDYVVTKKLKEAGDLLGITALDHLVLGDFYVYSTISERKEMRM